MLLALEQREQERGSRKGSEDDQRKSARVSRGIRRSRDTVSLPSESAVYAVLVRFKPPLEFLLERVQCTDK